MVHALFFLGFVMRVDPAEPRVNQFKIELNSVQKTRTDQIPPDHLILDRARILDNLNF